VLADPVLAALGFGGDLVDDVPEGALVARVRRGDRGAVTALGSDGEVRLDLDPLHPLPDQPVTGDWVAYDPAGPTGPVVVAVLPRRSALVRAASGDENVPQVLAANVDIVGIAIGLGTDRNPRRIERFVTVAYASGSVPLLLLTKADLVDDATVAAAVDEVSALIPGRDVIVLSTTDGRGLAELTARVADGRTIALIGPSGVGKSSLVNAIVGHHVVATGAVREGDGKGRHTTTHRELVPLPGGGVLLDTPGIRGLVPWDDGDGLALAFPEIEAVLGGCRFSNCSHTREPGCALLAAVRAGRVTPDRLEGWRRLSGELDRLADTADRRSRSRRTS